MSYRRWRYEFRLLGRKIWTRLWWSRSVWRVRKRLDYRTAQYWRDR